MTESEIYQLTESIEMSVVNITKEDQEGKVYKITLPFLDRTVSHFYIWAFKYAKSRKIQLSDGRLITKQIGQDGELQLNAIETLVKSYGLSLMEDLSVMETSNKPLTQRVTSFLQCLVAIDGVLRMWDLLKEK